LKEYKKKFKNETEKIKELKSTILLINQNIQQSKALLLQKFEEFFQKRYLIPFHVALEEQQQAPASSEEIVSQSDDVDPDAIAYIKAKKKVKYHSFQYLSLRSTSFIKLRSKKRLLKYNYFVFHI